MADNTVLPSGSGGDTIRDVAKTANSPAKTQMVILDIGGSADGAAEEPFIGSVKYTQPAGGSYFANVQQPKDTSRTFVTFNFNTTSTAATATLISGTTNVGGSTTGSQTSYTVPASTTLRIQSINGITRQATTVTTNTSLLSLVEAASGISSTSNVLISTYLPISSEQANGMAAEPWTFPIPDGLEIPAGTEIGIVMNNTLSTMTSVVSLVGYYY